MQWSGGKVGCIVPYRHGDRYRREEAAMSEAPYQISTVPEIAASTIIVVLIGSVTILRI
jgi:hypothetical protein